jgi:dipeptidyl aminopeptidase/acylaminoacyl peptidase
VNATLRPRPAPMRQPIPLVDPDALIEEARRRHRRRRRRLTAVVIVVAAVTAAVVFIGNRSSGSPGVVRIPGGPTVNVAAFAGHGRLAFISGRALWVLDGETRSLHEITLPTGVYPSQPMFSRDGRRIAFTRTTTRPIDVPGGGAQIGQLWLARGDGSGAHAVKGLAKSLLIGWSSTADVLAVEAGPTSRRIPFDSLTTVRLVSPDGRVRTRLAARAIWSAAWSPDGKQLAVVTADGHLNFTLAAYPIARTGRTIWGQFGERTRLNGMNAIVVDVAGWWPKLGIGIWVYGDGAVHNNDNTQLDLITAPARRPKYLVDTLSDRTTRVFAATTGRLAAVAEVIGGINGGRIVWNAKQLELCTSSACSPIDHPPGTVTLDPAWSPGGRMLAYVEAPEMPDESGWPQSQLRRWYSLHRLMIRDLATGASRVVASAGGATVPLWSRDGKSLLFVDDNRLSLLPHPGARPVVIARPLFRGAWPSYYGQMAWPAQFAWWSK